MQREKKSLQIFNPEIKFECLNQYGDWEMISKIFSYARLDSSIWLPFTEDDVILIFKLFKDNDCVIIKFTTLCQLILNFYKNKRESWANRICLKNLIMINFPIMFITFNGDEYLLELTKMPSYSDQIMEMIIFLMYEIQNTDIKS